jgi:uncharacterized protein with HEPN domain
MSDREWIFYLDDMIAFAVKVLDYTEGYDQERFEVDGKVYDRQSVILSLSERLRPAFRNMFDPLRLKFRGVRLSRHATA